MKQFHYYILLFLLVAACKNKSNESTPSQNNKQAELFRKYNLDKIKLPAGFQINVFAEVPSARSICFGADGTLFIGTRNDKVYAVVDANKDFIADTVYTILKDEKMPNGVAFKNGSLYIATINKILRFDDIENKLQHPGNPVIVSDKFPDKEWHGWKFIRFGPDGKLYVPVGAPCNVCESDSIFASITRMNIDGTELEIFAKGVRNTVGFDWQPDTKELWFTDNGRDELGEDIPSDELNHALQKGMHFGFPYCHQGDLLDPEYGKGKNCNDYTKPVEKLGAHMASLGMRFYTGNAFPSEYNKQIFIAEHGSWNRSIPVGYRVALIKLNGNQVISDTAFAEGWLQPGGKVTGRPVDVEVASDGSLLISDDYAGAIYRVTYKQ